MGVWEFLRQSKIGWGVVPAGTDENVFRLEIAIYYIGHMQTFYTFHLILYHNTYDFGSIETSVVATQSTPMREPSGRVLKFLVHPIS